MGLLGMLGRKGSARGGGDYEAVQGSPLRSPGGAYGKREYESIISEAISSHNDINWNAAQHLIEAVKVESRPSVNTCKDLVKAFKGFLSSTNATTSIKTMLVMDAVFFNADYQFAQYLGENKNMKVLVDIATKSLEPRQRDLMTQILVDWANKYSSRPDIGGPFHVALSSLRDKHLAVPAPDVNRQPGHMPTRQQIPMGYNPAMASSMMGQGQPGQPVMSETSLADQTAAIERETAAYCASQISAMLEDIKQLNAAIEMGGQAAATRGDEIWDAADRCMRWQKIIADMLLQELDETMMMTVLHANDTLHLALQK
eukprot:CAMPEP_0118953164 /NCGR_PEP_ID=MMETSP1169-20130426/56077_1 /TAXON_ID=36882 /ORGANISM="Pyramimonas obovata, Strain CCMP722" /LENGTH=313 /DNA_ID=CAMNT_0006900557 /DNA_START=46 /DNA_END=984 /DNA_ORIENTATION=-